MTPELELVLMWGDGVVAQKRVPFRSPLVPGEHFALPGELATHVLAFPSSAAVGDAVEAGEGALKVRARVADRGARPSRFRLDGALALALAAALLTHAVVAFLGAATPEDDDTSVAATRRATADAHMQNAQEGEGTPGTAGAPAASAFSIAPAPATPGTPTVADEPDPARNVATFGMLALLDTVRATPSPGFVVHGPSDATSVVGDGTWLQDLGGSGIGLSGVGQGGGGSGRGVELAGAVGGDVVTTALGHGHGRLMGGHISPIVCHLHFEEAVIKGHLDPSTIQRTVRQNEGRFRACYAGGVAKNPALQGRVAVKFLIGRDGTVASAEDTSASDLPDEDVRACVVRAFSSLAFPDSESVATVTYPFVFSPAD